MKFGWKDEKLVLVEVGKGIGKNVPIFSYLLIQYFFCFEKNVKQMCFEEKENNNNSLDLFSCIQEWVDGIIWKSLMRLMGCSVWFKGGVACALR